MSVFASMCACASHVCLVPKWMLNSLELELQMVWATFGCWELNPGLLSSPALCV